MNDQELKNLWQGQKPSGEAALAADEQIAAMRRKMAKMHRGLNTTDFLGLAVNAVVFIVFTIYFFTTPSFVTRIGILIILGGDLFATGKLIQRRRSTPQPVADAPVMEWLKYDLAKVHQHAEESRTVLWWSVLPFLIGTIVGFWGMPLSFSIKIGPSILMALIAAVTYWLNQRVWRKKWLPLLQELESLLRVDETVLSPETPRKYIMSKIIMVISGLLLAGSIGYLLGKGKDGDLPPAAHYSDPTSQMLETIRIKHKFPALAAAVVVDGKIVTTNVVGFRRNGGSEAVTVNDRFHIGSVTKSMTATVAAMLVEQGKISWTTTIGESFPEPGDKLHADYRGVTLEQLLAHRGGAPGEAPGDLWSKAWSASGTPAEQRLDFVKGLLARAPEAKPGTKHIYSNQGYAIAGVMLEKAAGKPWEELMQTMLFEPLGMNSSGFGAPATPGKVDQPWGHKKGLFAGFEPVPPGPRADNPPAIGPAGTVHCSLADLAAYAAFHLTGEQGASRLLKADSFKKLHTSAGDDYALGWVVLKRKWAGDRALMHNGSNTMFYVVVWMAPDRNCAVIVATNVGSDAAFDGCDEAAGNLIKQFFPK